MSAIPKELSMDMLLTSNCKFFLPTCACSTRPWNLTLRDSEGELKHAKVLHFAFVGNNSILGGGQGQKMMLGLFERSQWGGNNAFYRMKKFLSVQKLSTFKIRNFSTNSYKFAQKSWIFRNFAQIVSPPWIFDQISSNLHKRYPIGSFRGVSWVFFDFVIFLDFMPLQSPKNGRKCRFSGFSALFLG